jgi:hypothetical protein
MTPSPNILQVQVVSKLPTGFFSGFSLGLSLIAEQLGYGAAAGG